MAVESGERPKTPEQDVSGAQLKDQIDELRSIASVMGMEADLSSVRIQLDRLPEAERKDVERYMSGSDGSGESKTTETAGQETVASPERKERRPLKRRFVSYSLDADPESGVFSVHESFDEWNGGKNTYERRVGQSSGIMLSDALQEHLAADPTLKTQMESFSAAVRSDLDNPHGEKGKGMALVFDRIEANTDELRPKWYWYVGGQRYDGKDRADAAGRPITIDWKDIPPDIQELIRSDANYRKRKEYLKWLGPRVQEARGRIISGELEERFGTSPEDTEERDASGVAVAEAPPAPRAIEVSEGLEGDPAQIASVRNEMKLITEVYGTVGEPPDFSPVTTSETFLGLPETTQEALLTEAGTASPIGSGAERKGTTVPTGIPEKERPDVRVRPAPRTETRETAEKGPVNAEDVIRDAEPLMDYLRDVFGPTMAAGEEDLLERRVRDGAAKVLGDTYRKQGRAVQEGLIERALSRGMEVRPEIPVRDAGTAERGAAKETGVADMAGKFRGAYAEALREAKTRQDRAVAVLDLLQLARSGDDVAERAAKSILQDAERGGFGKETVDALSEARFLDAHPELPAHRTIRDGDDARIVLDEHFGLEDAVHAVVKDALAGIPVEDRASSHDAFIDRTSERLAQHARGGETRQLALDPDTNELLVKDIESVGDTVRSVYAQTQMRP